MAEKKAAASLRRGRLMLVVLLTVGLFAAVGSLAAAYVGRDDDRQPTATATASSTPTASPMTSEEARAEYYRQHPRATGWWQWVLIGGVLAALVVIGWLLVSSPARRKSPD